uniref:Uncharacterized protein n=1 Tax=Arundo donax TaxID=35708 RepID=A0A0A8Z861_ARUDO
MFISARKANQSPQSTLLFLSTVRLKSKSCSCSRLF